jgi:hypothetical protein
VLTSETIYEAAYIPSLIKLIKQILVPGGFALIAAKTNYFGCTGGIQQLKNVCLAEGCHLECVYTHEVTVRREILKLTLTQF